MNYMKLYSLPCNKSINIAKYIMQRATLCERIESVHFEHILQ